MFLSRVLRAFIAIRLYFLLIFKILRFIIFGMIVWFSRTHYFKAFDKKLIELFLVHVQHFFALSRDLPHHIFNIFFNIRPLSKCFLFSFESWRFNTYNWSHGVLFVNVLSNQRITIFQASFIVFVSFISLSRSEICNKTAVFSHFLLLMNLDIWVGFCSLDLFILWRFIFLILEGWFFMDLFSLPLAEFVFDILKNADCRIKTSLA